jgi:hypothetical protein
VLPLHRLGCCREIHERAHRNYWSGEKKYATKPLACKLSEGGIREARVHLGPNRGGDGPQQGSMRKGRGQHLWRGGSRGKRRGGEREEGHHPRWWAHTLQCLTDESTEKTQSEYKAVGIANLLGDGGIFVWRRGINSDGDGDEGGEEVRRSPRLRELRCRATGSSDVAPP